MGFDWQPGTSQNHQHRASLAAEGIKPQEELLFWTVTVTVSAHCTLQDLNVSNPRNVFFHPSDVLCCPALDVGISWSQTCLHLFHQDPPGPLAELSSL